MKLRARAAHMAFAVLALVLGGVGASCGSADCGRDEDAAVRGFLDDTVVQQQKRRCILGVGQSNMAGRGDVDNVTLVSGLTSTYANVNIAQYEATNADPPVQLYDTSGSLQPRSDPSQNMGPELTGGRYLDAVKSKFDFIKYAIGGTTLHTHWKPTATYPSTGGNLYTRANTYAQAKEIALNCHVVAIWWVQGESDADDSTAASNYETNLTNLIAGWRTIWPGIPVIYNRLSNSYTPGTHKATVRTAQANVAANVARTTMVDVDDLALDSGIHFTPDSYTILGDRLAKATLAQLLINIYPVANFLHREQNLGVQFTDASTDADGTIAAREWAFGDGNTSSSTNPSHTYASPGAYTATLTVTDNTGNKTSLSQPISVATATWSVDATSGVGTPASGADWTAIVSAHSLAMGSPTHLWLLQEASGNFAATIGGKTLTQGNTPGYRQTVTGWTRWFVGGTGAATTQSAVNITMGNLNATSVLVYCVQKFNASGSANRNLFYHGAAGVNAVESNGGTAKARLRNGGTAAATFLDQGGAVRPFWLLYDRTNSRHVVFTDIEKRSITYAGTSGAEFRISFSLSSDTSATNQIGYCATWEGSSAERTDAEIKVANQALGWTTSGWGN